MAKLKIGMDLSEFPKKLKLRHGIEGSQEWYEWKDKWKSVVIHRVKPRPWGIYFIRGGTVRMVEEELTAEDIRKGIIGRPFESERLEDCIEALKSLGFEVELVR